VIFDKVSFNAVYNDIIPHYVKGWNALGIQTNANPVCAAIILSLFVSLTWMVQYGGNKIGLYNVLNSINQEKGVRSDAANSYLPVASARKNLVILSGAHVCA
jgi:hypothetical protein